MLTTAATMNVSPRLAMVVYREELEYHDESDCVVTAWIHSHLTIKLLFLDTISPPDVSSKRTLMDYSTAFFLHR